MVFLGDIAFYMATLVFAAGIYLIHHANHHDTNKPCRLLKNGGYIVTVIAVLGMLCTGYYWLKYYSQDAYATPSPHHAMMKMDGMGMMGGGMMSGMMNGKNGMMGRMQQCMGQMAGKTMNPEMMGKMQNCMTMNEQSNSNDGDIPKEEHESHH